MYFLGCVCVLVALKVRLIPVGHLCRVPRARGAMQQQKCHLFLAFALGLCDGFAHLPLCVTYIHTLSNGAYMYLAQVCDCTFTKAQLNKALHTVYASILTSHPTQQDRNRSEVKSKRPGAFLATYHCVTSSSEG